MAKKKPFGFWKDRLQVLFEARDIKNKHGFDTLPSAPELGKLGYSSLSVAISKYHGGFHTFRALLGEDSKEREKGVWKNEEYAIGEARKLLMSHGLDSLPADSELHELGYSSLSNAVKRYHGGFRNFRRLMGEAQKQVESGRWKDLDFVMQEIRHIKDQHGLESFPTQVKLRELGHSGLAQAISKYHGGFHVLRDLWGGGQVKKKDGTWKDLEFTIAEIHRMMEKHELDSLPCQKKLVELGYSSLSVAISKYYGGYVAFRKLLDEHSKGSVDSVDALVQDLVEGADD